MSPRRILMILLWLAGTALAIFVILKVSELVRTTILEELMQTHGSIVEAVVFAALAALMLLISIPFVPGAEIGMALLSTFGASIAAEVYLATVLGLCLGFGAGRLIPVRATARALHFLCLTRAGNWLDSIADLPREEIAERLFERLEPGLARQLLRWRYLGLIVLINLPGNVVLGGGGGLALAAGASRLYSPLGFLGAVLVAVLPIPLTVLLMGGE